MFLSILSTVFIVGAITYIGKKLFDYDQFKESVGLIVKFLLTIPQFKNIILKIIDTIGSLINSVKGILECSHDALAHACIKTQLALLPINLATKHYYLMTNGQRHSLDVIVGHYAIEDMDEAIELLGNFYVIGKDAFIYVVCSTFELYGRNYMFDLNVKKEVFDDTYVLFGNMAMHMDAVDGMAVDAELVDTGLVDNGLAELVRADVVHTELVDERCY